jgi:hypothetical protein
VEWPAKPAQGEPRSLHKGQHVDFSHHLTIGSRNDIVWGAGARTKGYTPRELAAIPQNLIDSESLLFYEVSKFRTFPDLKRARLARTFKLALQRMRRQTSTTDERARQCDVCAHADFIRKIAPENYTGCMSNRRSSPGCVARSSSVNKSSNRHR